MSAGDPREMQLRGAPLCCQLGGLRFSTATITTIIMINNDDNDTDGNDNEKTPYSNNYEGPALTRGGFGRHVVPCLPEA